MVLTAMVSARRASAEAPASSGAGRANLFRRMTRFADLGLAEPILEALEDVGYESPSPIQEQAIPELLQGRDVVGQAQTGTGKTAAFGLPMIQFVDGDDPELQALVLTPTRELCIQVTQALRTYARRKGLNPVAVFGGAPIRVQQAQLKESGQIVVGTVGRVLDLISRHSLMLHACRYLVLDEADEMLDLGFLEDVERILSLTPNGRQTALFSATMPPEIRALAERHLYDPVTVRVRAATLTIDTVEQFFLETKPADKTAALVRVMEAERPTQAIVFTRTKIRCEQLYRTLRDKGMNVKALHGDMTQGARDGVIQVRAPARARGDRRRRARAGHRGGHPHHQLRRADVPRRLRAPHRAHRARRPLGPGDHLRGAAPAAVA
jgi:ATP-dependent RNA helicase DeaD